MADEDTTPANLIEVAGYTPSPGDRIRVVVNYGDTWRPIFWLQVRKDGSVYLGPRYANVTTMKKATVRVEGGNLRVRYDEGQEVTDPVQLQGKGKVSFHASGVIHVAGERTFREPLRTLTDQKELCRALFQHPSRFASVSTIEERDICLNYPINEECPLQALLFIAPANKNRLVHVVTAAYQINLLLLFSGLRDTPGLVIQFILLHGAQGSWPPYTYLLFEATAGVVQYPGGSGQN